MTAPMKKLVTRIGLALILGSMLVGVVIAISSGDDVPAWIAAPFFGGIVVAALPGFFPAKEQQPPTSQ